MTTDTIEQTPAQQTKAQAAERVQTLTTERERVQTRKRAAVATVERLHGEIADAERAGADAKTLAALRKERSDAQHVSADLDRVLTTVGDDLARAQHRLQDAKIACHTERYNEIVERQRGLTALLEQAVETIVETMQAKVSLARQQDHIQVVDVERPVSHISVEGVRRDLLEAITKRLDVPAGAPPSKPFSRIDWTCQHMHDGGELE